MSSTPFATVRAFARDPRGASAVGLALGASAVISVALLGFDLYSRIEAGTTVGRMAATMADYVSRESAPDGGQIDALGKYLHEQELVIPADMAYVTSVIRDPTGSDAATVSWVDKVELGDATVAAEIAGTCGRFGAEGGAPTLPTHFTTADGEVLVITEVCARLRREGSFTGRLISRDVYRLHVLPARDSAIASSKPTRPEPDA